MLSFRPFSFIFIIGFIVAQSTLNAQEFPIAVGSDTTFSGGAVYGGHNGLVAVCGNSLGQYFITAQLVGAPGYLIGPRIFLGSTGVVPGALPLFDGKNYFLVWRDFNATLQGQFIDTSGNTVGSAFTIATGVLLDQRFQHCVALGDSAFLAGFVKSDGYLYGQRVNKNGSLLGSVIQISNTQARDFCIAYDGTNYLLAWVVVASTGDKDIQGQFVSSTGALVGNNFVIDNGPNYSDNPTSLAFDGTRYLLAYHESPDTKTAWTIMGRFVTTLGTIGETTTLCDSSKHPAFPSIAFDQTNYLLTWLQSSNGAMMGRFYHTTGLPVDSPFVVFSSVGNKMPFGGIGFGGGLYLAVATRVDANFSDGDVYARFIQPTTTSVKDEENLVVRTFALSQNFPNPFNPTTTINYTIPTRSHVTLSVFNVLGQKVAELVNRSEEAGSYNATFNATGLASGVYLYRMYAGSFVQTRKLVVMK